MTDPEEISGRLKAARDHLGLSGSAFALQMGLSLGALRKIEAARNVPSGETLLKYSALDISPTWILTGEGPMQLSELRKFQQQVLSGAAQTQSMKDVERPTLAASTTDAAPVDEIDEEVFPRVLDAIARAYRYEGVSLTPYDLGKMAMEYFRDVVGAFSKAQAPLTREAVVPVAWLLTSWIQKALRKPPADVQDTHAQTKREASGS